MNNITTIGRILSAEFIGASAYGNPKFRVRFEDAQGTIFTADTANDAQCAYGINNDEYKEKAKIVYHQTRTGKYIITYCYNPNI